MININKLLLCFKVVYSYLVLKTVFLKIIFLKIKFNCNKYLNFNDIILITETSISSWFKV